MDNNHLHTSFRDFYNAHFHQVYHFLENRTNREDAKDLTHDVFVKVLQHFHKVQAAEDKKAYLFTISRHILIDHYKKTLIQQQVIRQLENDSSHTLSVVSALDYTPEQLRQLHQSIEALPEQRRKIIKRKKLEGLSTEEIADELKLSKRTVENQLYRAMLTLRERMAQFLSVLF